MVASSGVLSEGYWHGGPGVCLGDGQAEAETWGPFLPSTIIAAVPVTFPFAIPAVDHSDVNTYNLVHQIRCRNRTAKRRSVSRSRSFPRLSLLRFLLCPSVWLAGESLNVLRDVSRYFISKTQQHHKYEGGHKGENNFRSRKDCAIIWLGESELQKRGLEGWRWARNFLKLPIFHID